MLHRFRYWAHKTMTLHSMPLVTMHTNNFCACRWFWMSHIRQKCFVFIEFKTSFEFRRVLTAARQQWTLDSDSELDFDGFVTVEFGENGHFAANLAPETMWINFFFLTGMSDVNNDSSDTWQRFCCDVPDSNDSLTFRRRLFYVNLCFHLYLPSH